MINNFQDKRGSKWRKWDLHIHSLYTHLANGYKAKKIKSFIKKIIDENISVIGLTNYFNFCDKDFTLKNELEKRGVIVFLNLEIRLSYTNKENECCDIHIVFDSSVKKETINNFLNNLNANCNGKTKKTKELEGKEEFSKATIDFDHLLEKLEEQSLNLKNKYLIGCLSRGKGNCRTSTNYKKIVEKSDFIIHSSNKQENIEIDKNYWIEKQKKPLLQSSDAHNLANIGLKFTWIKADRTFMGLKQILYEPKERIKLQTRNPNDSKSKRLFIDHVIYKNISGEKKIYFNNNLNSIIGKRGNGKSTLIKNIVYKIDEEEFKNRDKKTPYFLKDFEVVWADKFKNSGNKENPKSVFYIPQKFLSSLAYEDGEKKEERNDFLKKLLSKNKLFDRGIKMYDEFTQEKTLSIQKLIQKLLAIDASVKENSDSLKKQGGKKQIKEEINSKEEEIKKNKGEEISEKEIKDYNEIRKKIEDNEENLKILKQDKKILEEMKINKNVGEKLKNVFTYKLEFHNLSLSIKEKIEKKLKEEGIKNLEIFIVDELKAIDEKIEKIKNFKSEKENIFEKLKTKIKRNKNLEDLNKELTILKNTIDNIKKIEKKLKESEIEWKKTIDSLAREYSDFSSHQSLIYKTIKFEESFSFIKIKIVGKYDNEKIKKFIDKYINTRGLNKSIKDENDDVKNFFQESINRPTEETIKKIISLLIEKKIMIKSNVGGIEEVLSKLLENPFEIDYLNSVKTKDNEISFQNMTGGQKAITFLELIFRFDKERYPIIIDQPEDDLDATGIANDLVKFVIEEKQNRQIFIATHSASLLICADTENVIVANFEKNNDKENFSYYSGSIENAERSKNIIDILEGGKEALKKRMKKLNIS